MAFLLKTSDIPATPPLVVQKATASEAYEVGEVLTLSSGRVTKCGATNTPVYICAAKLAACSADDPVHCYRMHKTQSYDTILQAAGTSLNIGDKVTIHTDGLQVTATTASGVAEIVSMDGTAVGDHVAVRF